MSGRADITAAVLSFNRLPDLKRTLASVLAIEGLRVLVLDNGSTDGSAGFLREAAAAHPERLRVILREENIGIAARNEMFEEINTPFLLTLDDDSWPRSGEDVDAMHDAMECDATIASVCASCIHPETRVAETAGIERFASDGPRDGLYDVVNIAAGGTLLRMDAVRETAGYGAEFFWGREENDLAFQLLLCGWRVTFLPDAVVWHSLSGTGRDPYRRLQNVTRNSYWLLWKYFPLPVALPVSALFTVRRLLPVLRDFRRLRPVLRGIAEGYGGIYAHRQSDRFTLRGSIALRGWFLKLLYE